VSNWIDRINRAILRRITRSSPVHADATGVQVGQGPLYPYTDLRRAVAFFQSGFVGGTISLALEFDAKVVVISEADEAWAEVLSALDMNQRVLLPSREWRLALLANPGVQIEVLRSRA
jgi:hypothetical protein